MGSLYKFYVYYCPPLGCIIISIYLGVVKQEFDRLMSISQVPNQSFIEIPPTILVKVIIKLFSLKIFENLY